MSEQKPYEPYSYYALALDPIHVGTGGYRLGEVELTIVREPGTNLPKVPGSSLAGAARAYTAMKKSKYRVKKEEDKRPALNPEAPKIEERGQAKEGKEYVSCAGKGGVDGRDHCGKIDCPVCVTYGFTIGPQNRSFHGLAQFYDAQILFFPVHSMVGPVWVTSAGVLADADHKLPNALKVTGHKVRTVPGLVPQPRVEGRRWGLNLGWLFLDVEGGDLDAAAILTALGLQNTLDRITNRLVLVSEDLFSLVVNSNLEVRTSVSINPATGAAEKGALFTYEALPRGTVLRFPVVYHNPQHYVFPAWVEKRDGKGEVQPTPFPDEWGAAWVKEQVAAGLRLMEYLGVGGMGTRGFGRLRILNLPPEKTEGGK
jgi:CRISPR-associated protein Cmr4